MPFNKTRNQFKKSKPIDLFDIEALQRAHKDNLMNKIAKNFKKTRHEIKVARKPAAEIIQNPTLITSRYSSLSD
jgi:hypothetical protein